MAKTGALDVSWLQIKQGEIEGDKKGGGGGGVENK